MAVDPNLSFPHKGRNSDKSGFSTRLAMMGWKANQWIIKESVSPPRC
jgi:hypothetical protein